MQIQRDIQNKYGIVASMLFSFVIWGFVFWSLYIIFQGVVSRANAQHFAFGTTLVLAAFYIQSISVTEGLNYKTKLTNMKHDGIVNLRVPDQTSAEFNFKAYTLNGLADGIVNIWPTTGYVSPGL